MRIIIKNKYLFFIDSDDYIAPTCIEKQCELTLLYGTDNQPVELVQFDYCVIENKDIKPSYSPTILIKEFIKNHEEAKNALLNNKYIHPEIWNKLILREFIIKNNLFFKEGIIWEDAYLNFFLAKHIQRICIGTDITYYYVRHSNSITNSKPSELSKKSSRIYISDLIDNIDPICKKAQKDRIFTSLIRDYSFPIDKKEQSFYKFEFKRFAKKCSFLGKIYIWCIISMPINILRSRIIYNYFVQKLKFVI